MAGGWTARGVGSGLGAPGVRIGQPACDRGIEGSQPGLTVLDEPHAFAQYLASRREVEKVEVVISVGIVTVMRTSRYVYSLFKGFMFVREFNTSSFRLHTDAT